MRQRVVGGVGGLGGVLQDRLVLLGQRVELGLVEDDLEVLGRLMVGAHHVVLGHVLGAEAAVRGRVVELEGVDHAALHGGQDLAARQLRHRRAHRLHDVGGEADRAVLQALQIVRALAASS